MIFIELVQAEGALAKADEVNTVIRRVHRADACARRKRTKSRSSAEHLLHRYAILSAVLRACSPAHTSRSILSPRSLAPINPRPVVTKQLR